MSHKVWPMLGVVLASAALLGCAEQEEAGPVTCSVTVVDENGNRIMGDSVGVDPTPAGMNCAFTVYADSVGSDTTPAGEPGRSMYFLDSVGSDTTP